MYPIIISAPHACTKIPEKNIKKRMLLDDYEIWKCSDPFTDLLKDFTCAWHKEIGKNHRLVCDLNRPPNHRAFHDKDFFGRRVFKPGGKFTKKEKETLLEKYWYPYHQRLEKKILKLASETDDPILFIDYHNTSGDHPLKKAHEYMPGIVISNLGAFNTGKPISCRHVSMPAKYIKYLQEEIKNNLGLRVEVNKVYKGGYNTLWMSHFRKRHKLKNKLYAIQIEYNLDFVANPISKHVDKAAFHTMQRALNKAIISLYKKLLQK